MIDRMMRVEYRLYGTKPLRRSWARFPYGQAVNWTQIILRANTYLGMRPCTFLGSMCYKFLSGVWRVS